MFAALGKNGRLINIVPSLGLVFIRMGNAPDNSLVPTTLNNDIWIHLNTVLNGATGFDESDSPDQFALSSNYPNPFNPSTALRITLLQEAVVDVRIFNTLGQEVLCVYQNCCC